MGWEELFKKAFEAVLSEYGAFAGFLLLMTWYLLRSRGKLWQARLKDKDAEIERLVEERNRLQGLLLKKRLTSGGKDDARSR